MRSAASRMCRVVSLAAAVLILGLRTEAVEPLTKFGYVPEASYIDTGVRPTQATRVEMRVCVAGVLEYWFGVWDSSWNSGAFCFGNDTKGVFTSFGTGAGGTEACGSAVTIPPGEHMLALTNGVFYCDGQVVRDRSGQTFALSHTLYLFGQNRSGTFLNYGDIWCDFVRIYDGDTLVRDYRAVYDGDMVRFDEMLSSTTVLGPYENRQIVPLSYLDVPSGAYASTYAYAEGGETGGSAVYGSSYFSSSVSDIGIPTADLTVETRAPVLGSGVFQEWFGLYDDSTKNRFVMANSGGEDTSYVGWGEYSATLSPAVPAGERIIHLGPDFAGYISTDRAVTNRIAEGYSGAAFSGSITKWLFLCAQNRTAYSTVFPDETMHGWKWFRVWKSGVLKRHYVPARLGTLVGFYDTVRGGLQASCGSASFVAGPDGYVDDYGSSALRISGLSCENAVTSLVVTVSGAPAGAAVRLSLSANGHVQDLAARSFSSASNAVFSAQGLMPATKYAVTAVASTNGFATAVTNTTTFSTLREGVGREIGGYEVLDAVRFNGTQSMSTGIVPTDHRIEVDYAPAAFANDAHIVGSCVASEDWKYVNWTEYKNSSGAYVYYVGHHGDAGYDWGSWQAGRHVLVLNDKQDGVYTHTFDGAVVESGSDKLASSTGALYLNFRGAPSKLADTRQMTFDGYVYSFSMTDNETGALVADYVPARDSATGTVGFYDRATATFKTATCGSFLSGDSTSAVRFDVRAVVPDGTALAIDLSCAGSAGTLRCYYGADYGAEDGGAWSGSVVLGEVPSVVTSVVRTVSLPSSATYVRFGVSQSGSVAWGPAYAIAWLPAGETDAAIPDTQALLASYVARFNKTDNENRKNAIPNADALAFLRTNAPRFACPDKDIERTYYFRWWVYRKHIRSDLDTWTVSEFLPDVGWAGVGNTVVCAAGHHVREGRWLRDTKYMEALLRFWLEDSRSTHRWDYVSWLFTSVCRFADVSGDASLTSSLLDAAAAYYDKWEAGFTVGGDAQGGDGAGGFVSTDNREGSEYSLSGGGYRPLVNSAMRSEAECLVRAARRAGRYDLVRRYAAKGGRTAEAMATRCWNDDLGFFATGASGGAKGTVRELHGYAPWYFGLKTSVAADWSQLDDPNGFAALYGLSFPERRATGFTISYSGSACEWNGPSWPFATSIALTALADELHRGTAAGRYADTFRRSLRQYARQHRLSYDPHAAEADIVPWIDEDFNEDTYDWVARTILNKSSTSLRGKDYNHSTFCDLVISGLVGIVPNGVGSLVVDPLVPAEWPYFALEDVRYHGHDVSVRFARGTTGYRVTLDGETVYSSAEPSKCVVTFPELDNARIRTLVGGPVSLTLAGGRLTLRVAAGAVATNAVVCLRWDDSDRGGDFDAWSHAVFLGDAVGPEGATNLYDAATLGLPDGSVCRVFLLNADDAYRTVSYVSARNGQSIDLGVSQSEVYGFDLGFSFNASAAAGRWNSVLAGTLDDFTVGQIQSSYRRIYLRHRKAEVWNSSSKGMDVLSSDQLSDLSACNAVALTNGVFTVNGVVLATSDTTSALGVATSNLTLFNNAAGESTRACDARCFRLRLYGPDGALVRDYRAALDSSGVPSLYERVQGRFYYVKSGQSAMEYDASTAEWAFAAEGSLAHTEAFRFHADSSRMGGPGAFLTVR